MFWRMPTLQGKVLRVLVTSVFICISAIVHIAATNRSPSHRKHGHDGQRGVVSLVSRPCLTNAYPPMTRCVSLLYTTRVHKPHTSPLSGGTDDKMDDHGTMMLSRTSLPCDLV